MAQYRRPKAPAVAVFFTVALAGRGGHLLTDEIEVLREAVRVTRARRPFGILAWVVLPDHMHAVWTLPAEDGNYSDRWGAIKARFSKRVRQKHSAAVGCKPTLRPAGREGLQTTEVDRMRAARSPSKLKKQDAGIWQRRFWEHHIRHRADLEAHVAYCWSNPVKHGLVARPADWPFSSIHRDIHAGRVAPEWAGTRLDGAFGE
ncbi:REP-associated tyrosine transposase [Marinovum sp.]|uniref:REP-associated tyrosine transposase n=1 Tax=Marinovum sp. TaxID=2024839 RepID=UPI002B275C17|nr:transposase [Marinovum sp.]